MTVLHDSQLIVGAWPREGAVEVAAAIARTDDHATAAEAALRDSERRARSAVFAASDLYRAGLGLDDVFVGLAYPDDAEVVWSRWMDPAQSPTLSDAERAAVFTKAAELLAEARG